MYFSISTRLGSVFRASVRLKSGQLHVSSRLFSVDTIIHSSRMAVKSTFIPPSSPQGFKRINVKVSDIYKHSESKIEEKVSEKKGSLLSESMTDKLEKEIVGEELGLKFVLKQAIAEIHALETRSNQLPLPSSMKVDEWKQLISLTDRRARFLYLESLLFDTMTFDEVSALDNTMTSPIVVPEELIQEAVGENEVARQRINLFLMHHEVMRLDGNEVPYEIKLKHLKEIAQNDKVSHMKKYMIYMNTTWDREKTDRIKKRRKQYFEKDAKNLKQEQSENCNHIFYGLGHNTIFLRLNEMAIRNHANWNAIREYQLGNPLVVDFSYMSKLKNKKFLKKLIFNETALAVLNNKVADTPFALHFTGVSPDLREIMSKALNFNEDMSNCAVEISEKHQLDLFPREKLVYLSPDSRNDLQSYNDDDIYVIGGIIDKGDDRAPLTLADAKRHNVRHARFPMRKTIGLHADLNVESCVAIMCDLKASNVSIKLWKHL